MAEEIGQKEKTEAVEPAQPSTEPVKQEASKDVKVAEIWIKDGRVMLDACPEFYYNKLMSIGILEYCKDIIKNTQTEEEKPKIQVAKSLNGLRNFLGKKKR
jgi:hypothetical protein